MIQEDKDLLLKDLCGRLPYGIIVNVNGNNETVEEINPFEGIITCGFQSFDVNECKPYLRAMDDMTEEERNEYKHLVAFSGSPDGAANFINWLNENHFDYRGLIDKGLAIEVTEENNPYEA